MVRSDLGTRGTWRQPKLRYCSQRQENKLLTAGCAVLAPKLCPLLALLVLAGPEEAVWLVSPRHACAPPADHDNIPVSRQSSRLGPSP